MKAIVTVGLGFGDEGKGTITDYLVDKYAPKDRALVVRYCGGAQAGHNVHVKSSDGVKKHTFSQWGAGCLARQNCTTYLHRNVIIDPFGLKMERDHLDMLGAGTNKAIVHPMCLVTTRYHRAINRIRELKRNPYGQDGHRHGSCGMGIGETRSYHLQYGSDALFAGDLMDRDKTIYKLSLIKNRYAQLVQSDEFRNVVGNDTTTVYLAQLFEPTEFEDATRYFQISGKLMSYDVSKVLEHDLAIFEGSQGTLLDEWHGFHPHTTWSSVTDKTAFEVAQELGVKEWAVIGLTRSYLTRHGNGPMPEPLFKPKAFVDQGNPDNDWQGGIRVAPLTIPLLRYSLAVNSHVNNLAVTCVDQTPFDYVIQAITGHGSSYELFGERDKDMWLKPYSMLGYQESFSASMRGQHAMRQIPDASAIPELLEDEFKKPVVIQSFGPARHDKKATEELVWSTL